jgi:hypothetical protein
MNKAAKPGEPTATGEFTEGPPTANMPNTGAPRKTGPTTFEDLLEEVKESTRRPKKQPVETRPEARSFREIADDEERVREARRKAAKKARELEKRAYEEKEQRRPKSYDDEITEEVVPVYENKASRVDYEDPKKANYEGLDDRQKRFTPFNIPAATPNLYAQLLKDPQGVRTAFIMSEILKRKY